MNRKGNLQNSPSALPNFTFTTVKKRFKLTLTFFHILAGTFKCDFQYDKLANAGLSSAFNVINENKSHRSTNLIIRTVHSKSSEAGELFIDYFCTDDEIGEKRI